MKSKRIYQQFESYYNKFAGGIVRYVYFKVSDYDTARDITSDTFIRYWKVLSNGEKVASHKALLYFIAKGLIVDYYRKKKHTKKISLESIDERFLGTTDTTEDALSQRQEIEQIYKKIKKLATSYQEVLFLHYVEDVTVKEIAFIQKKNENAVRVLLHRALKALKESL